MSAEPNLNETDYELISAYLDGMLSDAERSKLETRLHNEPELRRELNALRGTILLVRSLPALKAPRNFTLTPEMVAESDTAAGTVSGRRSRSFRRNIIHFSTLSIVSAAASIALVMLGFVLIFAYGEERDARSQSAETVALNSNTIPDDIIAQRSTAAEAAEETESVGEGALELFSDSDGAGFDEADDMASGEEAAPDVQNEPPMAAQMEAEEQAAAAAADIAVGGAGPSDNTQGATAGLQGNTFMPEATMTMEAVVQEAPLAQATMIADQTALNLQMVTAEAAGTPISEFGYKITPTMEAAGNGGMAGRTMASATSIAQAPAVEAPEEEARGDAEIGAAPGEAIESPATTTQPRDEEAATDLTPVGLALIAAGIILGVLTFLIGRIRNQSG